MSAETTNAEKIRRLPFVMAFDAFNSTFCQLTVFGGMFILFLSAMGLKREGIGTVQSLLAFCGVVSIFIAPVAARLGVKRVFIFFWACRNVFTVALLAAPWVYSNYGSDGAFLFIALMIGGFAMCRSMGEAASALWRHEIIPNTIRGRFTAADNIVLTLACVIALSLAGWYLGDKPSLGNFVWVMAVGCGLGVASLAFATMMPGGAAIRNSPPLRIHFLKMAYSLRDRNFVLYLLAVSLVTFGTAPLGVFVPLFLKDKVHLPQDTIVSLPSGALIGSLMASYFWGWAADRFGSKPVILSSLGLLLIPPLGWMLIPLGHAASAWIAGAIFVVAGIGGIGYGLGTGRQLYVTLIPTRLKTQYMSVYCAWMGITGGLGQVLAGWSMDKLPRMSGQLGPLNLNDYTPLFLFSMSMLLIGLLIQRKVHADGSIAVGKFMGMFLQGNPLMAVESLLRYSFAGRDRDRVSIIKRLGKARSPLSVDELTDALVDPSFSVRYEGIVAIARTRHDPALTGALVETLISGQPDLGVAAAWGLSRVGDDSAAPILKWTFASQYPLLAVWSARALASFGDKSILPEIQRRMAAEPAAPLNAAYADIVRRLESPQETAADLIARLRRRHTPSAGDLRWAMAARDEAVRMEGIVLACHHPADSTLTAALVDLLENGPMDLRAEAAWALARMEDPAAVAPLRRAFALQYPLLAARAARALAALGERRIVPELMRRLDSECDIGVRIAYASALGQLRAREAVGRVLALADHVPGSLWMSELNLALARMTGDESFFIQLWRQMRKDPGTAAARALEKTLKSLRRQKNATAEMLATARDAAGALARQDWPTAGELLANLIFLLPLETLPHYMSAVLKDCAHRLRQEGWQQMEALPLAVHYLSASAAS